MAGQILMPTLLQVLLLSAFVGNSEADSSKAYSACKHFSATESNFTILQSGPTYTNESTENWSATAWATPECIVRPSQQSELQQVVKYLTENQIQFAIRSGGHMPSPFAANINDGILIDLSLFNQVDYNPASSTVVIGPGNRWGDVYSALDAYNVTVVGGRVLDVGVGGLLLGSGLSYLSDLYGLACDNVVEYEIVLANGSAVVANAEENADLHWALKGGSNNFGIVTSFKVIVYPIHQVWGGVKSYSLDKLPALFSAVMEYQSNPDKDLYANFMLQAFLTNSSVGAVLNMVYLKPMESPPAFAPFYNITTTGDTTKIQTLTEMISGQGVPAIPRWDWFATSFQPESALYTDIHEILTTSPEVNRIAGLTSGTLALGIQPISSSAVKRGQALGNNALGLEAVNQTWFVLDTGWNWAKDDTTAHNSTRQLNEDIKAAAINRNLHLPYIFMNDASYDQSVIAGYGQANVKRLQEVQRKYDPDLVFQRLVPGGFKLL